MRTVSRPSSAAPRRRNDQQDDPGAAALAGIALLDGHRLAHLGHLAQRAVQLRRPDAEAADVEQAV
jgi:hypothetical protein